MPCQKLRTAFDWSAWVDKWGFGRGQYPAHVAIHGNTTNKSSPVAKFIQQRQSAKTRGIEWKFTFAQWWAFWDESGKWLLRGRGKGYVMARFGDIGPYCIGNVYICTSGQNFSDSYIAKPSITRFAASRNGLGNGKGYYPTKSKTKPFAASIKGKHIGRYATSEEARAAYLKAASEILYNQQAKGEMK